MNPKSQVSEQRMILKPQNEEVTILIPICLVIELEVFLDLLAGVSLFLVSFIFPRFSCCIMES